MDLSLFVILLHECPVGSLRESHWDLMLERAGVLWTWELREFPLAYGSYLVRRLADHRLAYLKLEGPLSENRGTVSRVDSGELLVRRWDDAQIEVRLELGGCPLELRLHLENPADPSLWCLTVDT